MSMPELQSEKRTVIGKKVQKDRAQGKIPAVLYGHGIKNQDLYVDALVFERLFAEAGESTIIALDTGAKAPVNVLVYDYQQDPLTDRIIHIDFFQVRMDEKIDTEVPFEFIGEAPAVKELGGVLVRNMEHLTISCLPVDLPGSIAVDLSILVTFDDRITVGGLALSDKLTVHVDDKTVIALVTAPRTEEEIEALDEDVKEDVSQVEGVEKEGDDTGEEGEGEEKKEEEKPAE